MRDLAFGRQFKKSKVDKALDRLPLRKGPLDVLQWVTTDLTKSLDSKAERERLYRMSARARAKRLTPKISHEVYARVDRKRWYRMSKRARAAAVRAFYREAEKQFQKKGIRDFVLVVTPLTPTTEHLPAFAIGRGGSASLTPLGRNRPDNGV